MPPLVLDIVLVAEPESELCMGSMTQLADLIPAYIYKNIIGKVGRI